MKVKSKDSNEAQPQASPPGYTGHWLPTELGLLAVCVCVCVCVCELGLLAVCVCVCVCVCVYTECGQGGRQELHLLAL